MTCKTESRYVRGWYHEKREGFRSWRKNGIEICYRPKQWWHLSFGIWNFGGEDTNFSFQLLGWSFYFRSPIQLENFDDAWKFDLNEYGIQFDFGSPKKRRGHERRSYCVNWPWQQTRQKTEILTPEGKVHHVRKDCGYWSGKLRRIFRMKRKFDWSTEYDKERVAAAEVSVKFPFVYTLRNGEKQHRTATCHLKRSTYGWQWFPFIRKSYLSMEYQFDEEVGECSGSWKGGVIASGIKMTLGETMEQAIERLKIQKF